MYDVTMPKLSDSMETGKVVAWKVKEGDEVHEGDVLAEVESDKAVMELECFRDGAVAEILHGADAEVPVGEVIARIALRGEAASKEPAPVAEEKAPEEQAKGEIAEQQAEKAPDVEEPAEPEEPTAPAAPAPSAAPSGRVAASPYARRLAAEKGLDVARIRGTGPGGRIIARDVEAAGAGPRPEAAEPVPEPPAGAPAPGGPRPSPDEELPPIEVSEDEADVEDAPFRLKTQARRVVASQHVIPHFYVTRGADVTELLTRKDLLKQELGATLTHVVMYACVRALKEHPEVNRSYDRGRVIKWKGIRLGLAVDTEAGLTVAVLPDAQDLSLAQLAERTRSLVETARAGKLSAEQRRHATITVTNLGMFDVEHFEPIINPPSSVTLAVASALPSAIVKDGAVHVGHVMKLTAACDHRMVDGATAARFLACLRGLLEDPDGLLAGG